MQCFRCEPELEVHGTFWSSKSPGSCLGCASGSSRGLHVPGMHTLPTPIQTQKCLLFSFPLTLFHFPARNPCRGSIGGTQNLLKLLWVEEEAGATPHSRQRQSLWGAVPPPRPLSLLCHLPGSVIYFPSNRHIFRAALGLSRKDRFPIYPAIPTHTQPPPLLVPQSGTLVTVSGPTLTPHYYPYPQHICICEQHPGASGAGGGRCPLRCCSWSLR